MADQNMINEQEMYQPFQYGSPDPDRSLSDEQFKYLLNNNDDIVEFEKYLRGIEYDDKTQTWVKYREPYMNEKGINTIMGELKLRTGRGSNLAVMKKNEIIARARSFSQRMNILLNTKYEEFGLDPELIAVIHGLMEDIVYLNLTRSEDAFQQKVITKIWKGGEVSRPMTMGNDIPAPRSRIGMAVDRMLGR